MAIYDTSSVIDNSIFLKAKLDKNMVGSNYYIDNLQSKRDKDWEYRYNVVEIEEENEKYLQYTQDPTRFSFIEAVISSVKSDKGVDLGSDWAYLAFKSLKHPVSLGKKYRFSLDFPNMREMSEEDKHYETSEWLCVNKNPIRTGNSCLVRRCNSFLTLLGSPTGSEDYITEFRDEPCILENQLKYMQTYYNLTVPIPQSEWYATLQLNYFTNNIALNDRFIIGAIDTQDVKNNQVYKVKALTKSAMDVTYVRDNNIALEKTPILILALDKDLISAEDDLTNRIAKSAPIYKTQEIQPEYEYYIKPEKDCEQRILLNEKQEYSFGLYYNNSKMSDVKFKFSFKLNGIVKKNWGNYFKVENIEDNKFVIHNIKTCNRGNLEVTVSCEDPQNNVVEQTYEIELGGFY